MKIFIMGKMDKSVNYNSLFKEAEMLLNSQGHECASLADLDDGFLYEDNIPICTAMIDQCDAVYLLNNWEESDGCKTLKAYAECVGKEVLYQ